MLAISARSAASCRAQGESTAKSSSVRNPRAASWMHLSREVTAIVAGQASADEGQRVLYLEDLEQILHILQCARRADLPGQPAACFLVVAGERKCLIGLAGNQILEAARQMLTDRRLIGDECV